MYRARKPKKDENANKTYGISRQAARSNNRRFADGFAFILMHRIGTIRVAIMRKATTRVAHPKPTIG